MSGAFGLLCALPQLGLSYTPYVSLHCAHVLLINLEKQPRIERSVSGFPYSSHEHWRSQVCCLCNPSEPVGASIQERTGGSSVKLLALPMKWSWADHPESSILFSPCLPCPLESPLPESLVN